MPISTRLTALIAIATSIGAAATAPVARIPVLFEKTRGGDAFLARGKGYTLALHSDRLELRAAASTATVRLPGIARGVVIEPQGAPSAIVNDYTGPRSQWTAGGAAWREVHYRNAYPGIDLLFYGQAGAIEYDAKIAPGADPSRVCFEFASAPKLSSDGDIAIPVGSSTITWRRPVAYQDIDGRRVPVAVRFHLRGRRLSFDAAAWDKRYALTIDPTLVFSTFLGGTGNEIGRGIALDSSGNVYVTGATSSGDLPVTSASYQSAYKGAADVTGPADAFVAKLNATGTSIVYITYLGGTGVDWATAIAADSGGNAFVTGFTDSPDFPTTTGVFQTHFGGDGGDDSFNSTGDAFVTKFDPTGKLVWSTYLGGGQDDSAGAIALDSSGNVIVAGATVSSNFPTTPTGYQTRYAGGNLGKIIPNSQGYVSISSGDAFLVKLDPAGAKLLAGTYLGGGGDDIAATLAIDSTGNIWTGGATTSSNFPVSSNAFQSKYGGASGDNLQAIVKLGDGFISELSSDLSKLTYSTYLGGNLDDAVQSIAIDSSGTVYACGITQSSNFPIKGSNTGAYHGPAQPPNQRLYMLGDGFVTKLVPSSGLVFSQYLGGKDDDAAEALALDSAGNVLVAGMTNSSDFPVTSDAMQAAFGGASASPYDGVGDGFLTQLNGATGAAMYSTFIGSSWWDAVGAMAVSASGQVYLLGYSASPKFVTTSGVVQPTLKAPNTAAADLTIQRFSFASATGPSVGGVANSASYSTAVYSPGEIVTIFGQNMGAAAVTTAAIDPRTGRIATTLNGTQVFFDGVAAPLIYVSAAQASAIIPYEVAGKSSSAMTVAYNGSTSAGVPLKIGAASPGLFSINQQGTGQGAIVNQDNTFNSSSNPAAAGSYVAIYGTGEGLLTPPGITGQLAPGAAPFPAFAATPSITVGGIPVAASSIIYAGPVPGFVEGEFQINLQIPSGISPGNQPLIVTIGGASSLASYTVAVK